jgi:Chlorophyllase enzyme
MKKAVAVSFLMTVFASALVACSGDQPNRDAGLTMPPGSPVQTADTGTPPASPSGPAVPDAGGMLADAGAPPDAGGSTGPVGNDAGAPAPDSGADAGDAGPDAGPIGSGDPEFDTCYAQVKPVCVAKEMNTAALMETPCKALTNIPIPLTDGTNYGPKTITGGPYGAKIDWNEGAGSKFVSSENELLEQGCLLAGIDTFAQPMSVNDEIKNLRGLDWTLFTVFRPACMKKGEKYPVIAWANGTCGETHGYSGLLSTVASYGFVVIAPNSTWTAAVTTASGTPVQVSAMDYAEALNADAMSPLFGRLDLSNIGAMGHSQGAAATVSTAADPRVKSAILWNTGTSSDKPFLNVSGDEDVGGGDMAALKSSTEAATKPGAWIYFHKVLPTGGMNTGHLLLMEQPERVTDLALAWWKWQLKGDQEAKKMFVGSDCGLCKTPADFEYGHNTLLQ